MGSKLQFNKNRLILDQFSSAMFYSTHSFSPLISKPTIKVKNSKQNLPPVVKQQGNYRRHVWNLLGQQILQSIDYYYYYCQWAMTNDESSVHHCRQDRKKTNRWVWKLKKGRKWQESFSKAKHHYLRRRRQLL